MITSMDLNASPLPEEDDEVTFAEHLEEETWEEHVETAVETLRRVGMICEIAHRDHNKYFLVSFSPTLKEREERRRRMKREHPDEGPKRDVKPLKHDTVDSTRNFRCYDGSKLPPGWLECPRHGHAIGYIIPSKVPLGEAFNDFIKPGKRYSSKQVIHQQKVFKRELGLVIDLTNTSRYYSPSDWKKQGIKYFKIACKGRNAVPDNESVNLFVYEVLQFVANQKHSKKYLLVHCTHGYNRTGFMIIHYLIRSQHISVSKALQLFADARPPGIYKQDYIDALYKFYHEKRPETVTCPPTPEWKRSSDLDLNDDAAQDEDEDGAIAAPSHEQMENEVMTNDDVLGDAIPYYQQDNMRKFCYHMLKCPVGPKGCSQFPGSHPVSLNRENLQLLRQRYYYATWKADGTRYMMLITSEGCCLIDRNFCFRRVQMRFPLRTNEGPSERTHDLTLLDGEMVIDTLPTTQKQERRYLLYDLMALNGQSVIERPFSERWKLLEKEVIEPRNFERSNIRQIGNPYYRYDMEPFRVRRKDFWLLSTVNKLLMEFIPRLSHAADGLIFQGWDDSYVPKTHEGLLKWKYPELNSVDFLFEVGDDESQRLYLLDRGRKKQLEGSWVVFRGDLDLSTFSGKIIECSWDPLEQCWVYLRTRTDKSTPNEFSTYMKVMRSIRDNITQEILLKEIEEIICLPMYADRQRSDKAHMQQQHANRSR